MLSKYILVVLFFFITSDAISACDCGSTDSNNPCIGRSINITVAAGAPNGGSAVDNVYNWSFSSGGKDARCGQFANGDYWIAPADGEATVTITSISSTSHPALVSADEDPETEAIGLLSGAKSYGNYSSHENILTSLPKTYSSTTSIVAAIQRNEAVEGNCGTSAIVGECADSYNVLTVLDTIPPMAGAETIRPNVTGKSKELLTFSNFDFARVPRKSFLSGTDAAGLDAITRRWSHSIEMMGLHTSSPVYREYSEGGRAFRAHTLIDDYGAGVSAQWYKDLMVLFSDDHTDSERNRPLAAMLTYGLTLYHAIYDAPDGITRDWGSGASQHVGKFMPVVFLAALARDSKYATNIKTASSHLWDRQFSGPSELAQVLPSSNGPVWGDIQPQFSPTALHGSYWDNLFKSQCYDGAPEMEKWTYYTPGQWQTFSSPIGTLTSGEGLRFTIWSRHSSASTGDLRIKNVFLDGSPINFNAITLENYDTGTTSGTISADGSEYVIAAGTTVKKISTETFNVTPSSVLEFEWYQDAPGTTHGIGFENNEIYSDGKRIVQLSGIWFDGNLFIEGCVPSIGAKNMYDPYGYIDGPPNKPGTSYLVSSLGPQRDMVATMFLMPEVCDVVNYEPLIEYVDRTSEHGVRAGNDPCVTPDSREDFTHFRESSAVCNPYTGGGGCLYYGVTWGPQDKTNPDSPCITTPTPPYTKVGRFSRLDGEPIDGSYGSAQVSANWKVIRGTSGSCRSPRRLFRNVRLADQVE